MTGQRETVLCRYQYDPLDRVVSCAPLSQDSVQHFYRKNHLATEIQGTVQCSLFEYEEQLLAQRQHHGGHIDSALLATDLQRSILHFVAVGQHQRSAYSAYGHRSPESGLISLLGFNGERRDSVTGHYLLGSGYRVFNPVLMRFHSPDNLSPFEKGGVNAYAYCSGDPVNRVDPTGHVFLAAFFGKYMQRAAGLPAKALGSAAGRPTRVASNATTLDALDLASSSRLLSKSVQSSDIKKLGSLFDAKEQASNQLKAVTKDLSVLERLVKAKGFDPAEIPAQPAHKAYIKAQNLFSQAETELTRGMDIHFLKYPAQRKNAVEAARWAVRRSSI
ncbi:RHS repeat-associated core domain-containing protein [Pseudomonas sp. PGPR40]|uniref:RHS repeat-associated core domain-containing protein n=1 Tax=Pseudomonas sp. PGPR40 TaxID=2913476 RepID=UPI001ED9CB3D|nr:RHS repeat-associated core domain-containing protein [Pseudomonas sp. PGPR40]